MKLHHFLILVFLFCLVAAIPASASNESSVNVTLTDDVGNPLSNVKIRLFLYQSKSDYEVSEILIGDCRTDKNGQCSISFQDAPHDSSGFYRGYLQIGKYGQKNLLWPGGQLDAIVWLDAESKVYSPRESEPYDWQEPDRETMNVHSHSQTQVKLGRLITIIVILGSWLTFIFMGKKQ